MSRFFALPESFENEIIRLNAEESRHLRDVLRLRIGEKVDVFDGEGREFSCEIEKIERKETSLKIIKEIAPKSPESNLDLTLAMTLMKGEKFDFVVQKAVELGVNQIIPIITKRCDVKLRDTNDSEKRLVRWRKIALEAAKQCGRAKLTRIEMPVQYEKFLEFDLQKKIAFSERNGIGLSGISFEKIEKIAVIVGSEGGWEDSELELAKQNNCEIVTLGGRILRAETAGIVCAGIVQHLFGDLR